MRNLEDPVKRKECTDKSIEARKDGKAGKKQSVTRSLQGQLFNTETRTTYQNKHIKDEILELEAAAMFDKNIFGKDERWIESFMYNYLKTAKDDPNSRAAERLASVLFSQTAINDIHEYLERQNAKDIDYFKYLIRSTLYDKQTLVFDSINNEPYTKHIIINSRRSGKTELIGRIATAALLQPDAHVVYINRNSSAAIRQIRAPLMTTLNKIGLRIIKGSVENQELYLENGSQLLILGNNNVSDIDKLRGERISCCLLDECGHQRNIRQLMREVIDPALKDYGKDARLVIVGTPPRIPRTYVEEIWNSVDSGWKKWHWTFQDNPYIPDREHVIEEVCKDYGVTPNAAFVQREYFGRMDAYDTDAQVFHGYQITQDIIEHPTHAYVGVDWGFEDKAAVVGVLADQRTRKAVVVKTWSEAHTSVSTTCEKVKEMREYLLSFNPTHPVQIICDNNAKQDVYELIETYKLPNVTTAYKYDKDLAIEQLAEWLRAGTMSILNKDNDRMIDDMNYTLWERDEETDKLTHKIDDELYHPNAAMALLYTSRQFDYDCMVTGYSKTAKDIVNELLNK